MKAKTNLELHMDEIIFDVITKKRDLDIEMYTIYRRETGKDPNKIGDVLEWFSDVPRETLELSKEIYDFLKAYKDEFMCEQYSINNYAATNVLIDIGIIPKKYATYKVSDLIKIIKVKKESNK